MLSKILAIIVVSGACGIAMSKISKLRKEAFEEVLEQEPTEGGLDFTDAIEGAKPLHAVEKVVASIMAIPLLTGIFALSVQILMVLTFFISIPLMILNPSFRTFVMTINKVLGLSVLSLATFAICKTTTE